MSPVIALFKREFLGYFRTPVAYVFLAVFIISAVSLTWFVGGFFESNQASLDSLFVFFPWLFLFLIPAVGMRLWSEERRSGTLELLLTYPVTVTQAVIGKFLAAWAFVAIGVLATAGLPLTVAYLGDPDWGPIFSGYLGTLLMAGAYLAICSLMSSLTRNQVIAFVLSLITCLVLVFLGWSVFNSLMVNLGLPVQLIDALSNFSFVTHYQPFARGLITARDSGFFAALIISALWLNRIVLER